MSERVIWAARDKYYSTSDEAVIVARLENQICYCPEDGVFAAAPDSGKDTEYVSPRVAKLFDIDLAPGEGPVKFVGGFKRSET